MSNGFGGKIKTESEMVIEAKNVTISVFQQHYGLAPLPDDCKIIKFAPSGNAHQRRTIRRGLARMGLVTLHRRGEWIPLHGMTPNDRVEAQTRQGLSPRTRG